MRHWRFSVRGPGYAMEFSASDADAPAIWDRLLREAGLAPPPLFDGGEVQACYAGGITLSARRRGSPGPRQ